MATKSNNDAIEQEDLSYSGLDSFPEFLLEKANSLTSLQLDNNSIMALPRGIGQFTNLHTLDVSNNRLTYISPEIWRVTALKSFTARNNLFEDDALPKEFDQLQSLEILNLSGNRFTEFPPPVVFLCNLRRLFLGANRIRSVPEDIGGLQRLEMLYLGGNQLEDIPASMGNLKVLVGLVLCDNKLESIPSSICNLRQLESLSLHNNRLATLPPELVTLNLKELSLRNNPLVVRFAQDLMYEPPSLLELSGRVIKIKNIPFTDENLPRTLVQYLESAQSCVNPKCKGVYFSSRVEHVKFVDFCGKYRLPLLEYLCSPRCTKQPLVVSSSSESDSEYEDGIMMYKMKKILLG